METEVLNTFFVIIKVNYINSKKKISRKFLFLMISEDHIHFGDKRIIEARSQTAVLIES